MNRRTYLAAIAGGTLGGLAGCLDTVGLGSEGEDVDLSSIEGSDGSPSNICEREPGPGFIPAIIEPKFAKNYQDLPDSPGLDDSMPIIGIERVGEARAYPVVATNEIVNDSFEEPVLVTYCPLCNSGLTAIRKVDGEETIFGNTSYTWSPPRSAGRTALEEDRVFGVSHRREKGKAAATNDPNLVMFDEATGSYWSQLLAQAICGPRIGDRLEFIPSTVTDWGTWRETHPETTVMLPSPYSKAMER